MIDRPSLKTRSLAATAAALGLLCLGLAGPAFTEEAQQQPVAAEGEGAAQPAAEASAEGGGIKAYPKPRQLGELTSEEEIKRFCTNIADAAKDRRYLLQKQELEKLQGDINARIAILEKRKAEYEDWLKRRNDFLAQTEANLIGVYKTMKADAAAPQLQELRPEIAASIIMKLPARQSGLILSEMDPRKAAMVAAVMTSAADPNTSKDPS
ncbi:MotE family protein [Gellertiella hungarica]|uniref:Flagellar motility protein MotE (MotC chaperone) n=1 Tax=Gellertiella hungarica TaxID=1572859 RepID=A0A7W6NK24_9HYPH|nr:MotE family protein [Gellertiella hungarica]MBB4064119.1 flagellar motility protein MotE (MotC chaperone) [Gellertiella hungarica]